MDGVERVGDSWRRHWDSLRLFTPVRYNSLPGLPFPGGSWQFPGKEEVAAYLETYALVHDLPVRLRTRVDRLEGQAEGGFTAHLGTEMITCENVVVATGGNGCVARVPEFAGQLDPGIDQLHSSQYRRPSQLPAGTTLVVGAANSGCEIAYELAADRPVTLSGRDPGHEPFRPGSLADRAFVPLLAFPRVPRRHRAHSCGPQDDAPLPHARHPGRAGSGHGPGRPGGDPARSQGRRRP